jgi:glutaconyl-CoA/methylmalonyl-CoA decarboxylase subunit gamma
MKYYVTINDKRYEVDVEKGKAAILSTTEISTGIVQAAIPAAPTPAVASSVAPAEPQQPQQVPPEVNVSGEAVKAPMPGGILDIKVTVGSIVKKGDVLLVLEAMKMENEITAAKDGIVTKILFTKGGTVAVNDVLVLMQ